ncbi:MAG: BrxE family protein [Candidatus Korobacteraceae bacterium]|jgi:hypothetical protein
MSKYGPVSELRAIVAAVGERAKPAWWHTNILTDVGLRVTGRVFPRTALVAALKSVSLVAQLDHDHRVGCDRYHLFRLPPEIECDLFGPLMNRDELRGIEAAVIAEPKGLIAYLEGIAGAEKGGPGEGPVRMGSFSDLGTAKWVSVCAAQYLASVESGIRRFPYFDSPKAGH